jgi:hypothetical protein
LKESLRNEIESHDLVVAEIAKLKVHNENLRKDFDEAIAIADFNKREFQKMEKGYSEMMQSAINEKERADNLSKSLSEVHDYSKSLPERLKEI